MFMPNGCTYNHARYIGMQVLKGTQLSGQLPKSLDIYDLEESFVPERWLDPQTTPTVCCMPCCCMAQLHFAFVIVTVSYNNFLSMSCMVDCRQLYDH